MRNERENWIFERICKFFERICKLWSHDYWLPLQQNKNYAGQNDYCAMQHNEALEGRKRNGKVTKKMNIKQNKT